MEWRVCKIADFNAEELKRCFALAEPERKQAILQIRSEERQKETLCGEWLAKTMLSEQCNLPIEKIHILRQPKGKPFAADCPLHFNISHSGGYVACAISEQPLGIDLERNRGSDLRVARRICSPRELAWLAPDQPDAPRRFLQIWTAKEAYVKYLGTGLAALKTADFSELQPRLQQIINKDYILSIYQ